MTFFHSTRRYAVLGASNSPYKFGNKVMKWYLKQNLNVTPINPSGGEICGVPAFNSITSLIQSIKDEGSIELSVSVVTPADRSIAAFEQIKNDGFASNIKSVWFQPGSYDSKVIEYLKNEYEIPEDDIIENGECILVSGRYKLRESESLEDAKLI